MVKLTKCSKDDCNNLTKDVLSEYGTYCFQHSNMTHKPRVLVKATNKVGELASTTMVFSTKVQYMDVGEKVRSTVSPVRRIPPPVRKTVTEILASETDNIYDTMECCVCDDKVLGSMSMKCGHVVCGECLDLVRNSRCPVCLKKMEGPLITEYVVEDIREREKEDMRSRENEDATAAKLAELGMNPNTFYF